MTTGTGASPPTQGVPVPVAVHLSVEAESPENERGGQTFPRSLAAASGGIVISHVGKRPANTLRFAGVTVPDAGSYTVTVYYVSPNQRQAAIAVNGQPVTTPSFPATGGNGGSVGSLSIRLPLVAGANTVEFGNAIAWAPDLDRIVVDR